MCRPCARPGWNYALDLQNFNETSHNVAIVPILITTRAEDPFTFAAAMAGNELRFTDGAAIDAEAWERGR